LTDAAVVVGARRANWLAGTSCPPVPFWDEIREKLFKNYALKSMENVYAKLEQAALYIERNPATVKSITSFPYIVRSI
jgi:hypothetical protein